MSNTEIVLYVLSISYHSSIITVFQAAWFTIKEVARINKGYPITTLELTTLSFCFITFMISVLWYHKPSITKPQYIGTKDSKTVEQIREYARCTVSHTPEGWRMEKEESKSLITI